MINSIIKTGENWLDRRQSMKKIVSIIMLTALLFTSITNGTTSKAISQYKRITSGNYEYAVLDEANKTATVLKIKPTKEVVIPKIIDGYSINSNLLPETSR